MFVTAVALAGQVEDLEEYNKRMLQARTGAHWFDLGRWCLGKGLLGQAEHALLKARVLDPRIADSADCLRAETYMRQKKDEKAKALLEAVLARRPDHPRAKRMLGGEGVQQRHPWDEQYAKAIEHFRNKEYPGALSELRSLRKEASPKAWDYYSAQAKSEAGETLLHAMAICRLQEKCQRCAGDGLRKCVDVKCQGRGHYWDKRLFRDTGNMRRRGLPLTRTETERFVCAKCEGFGKAPCRVCYGSGVDLSTLRLDADEREALVDVLYRLAEDELVAMKYSKRAAERRRRETALPIHGGDDRPVAPPAVVPEGIEAEAEHMNPVRYVGLDPAFLIDAHDHAWKAIGYLRLATTIKVARRSKAKKKLQKLLREAREEERLSRAAATKRLRQDLGFRPDIGRPAR